MRSFDFPRVQFAVLGSIVLVAIPLLLAPLSKFEYTLLAVVAVSIGLLLFRMIPYTSIAPCQAKTARHNQASQKLSLLSANVLQSNRRPEKLIGRILELVPSIVLVVETDDWWEEQMSVLEEKYPYRIKQPQDNTYGMLLYSRIPIEQEEVRFLVEGDVPSMFLQVMMPSGQKIRVIGVHPKPPRPDIMQDATHRDAELLIVAKYACHEELPVIVMGDFNDVAWSHTTRLFQRISGLLDPRRGRGFFNTFHADYPFFRYPLDHIFHSSHFSVIRMRRLGHIGSDHFPVYAELSVEESASNATEGLIADEFDDREAKRMIREAFE